MNIKIFMLALVLSTSSNLLANPDTLHTINKLVSLTRMTSPTNEVETTLQAWLKDAQRDPENAMLHGWNFLTNILSKITTSRDELLKKYAYVMLEPQCTQVLNHIRYLNEGIGYLMRLLEIMAERAPSPIQRTRSDFWAKFYHCKASEKNSQTEYIRCITPPADLESTEIVYPHAVYPATSTPLNSPRYKKNA